MCGYYRRLDTTFAALSENEIADYAASGEPQPVFWSKLETHDDYGWNA